MPLDKKKFVANETKTASVYKKEKTTNMHFFSFRFFLYYAHLEKIMIVE